METDGSIKYSGSIAANDNEPFIVIGFANNRDGKANIDKQAVWLNTAFKALVKLIILIISMRWVIPMVVDLDAILGTLLEGQP
ncbi:hypothetical protein S101258_00157 [Lactiplantibacillus plantarum subsp. plantarum]|uniref:Uncharacterized protein n=1 Tax=Lactiplantibacillus plantarum subsp. plantarum TaxID=337330 RepID=A0A2S3U9X0_LACPN|nr:hypothetical protein S101258_00157 [Lactiplantibacillus plantarum subsp. plantarum]